MFNSGFSGHCMGKNWLDMLYYISATRPVCLTISLQAPLWAALHPKTSKFKLLIRECIAKHDANLHVNDLRNFKTKHNNVRQLVTSKI